MIKNIFEIEKSELLRIIENSYRKFKSHIYYSNSMSYLKKRIADFESVEKQMETTFESICNYLLDPNSSKSIKYAKKIQKTIKYKVLPKISTTAVNEGQIVDNVDRDVNIKKVNLFFDGCMDLFILDTLWTLIIGKLLYDFKIIPYQVKANSFAYDLFTDTEDILKSINFKSLSVFIPYFKKYKEWKDNALYSLDYLYEDEKDSIMFSLDVSNYFYSVDFCFENLYKSISSDVDTRIEAVVVLNKLMEKIYGVFANQVCEIRTDVSKGTVILPIGLLSSAMLGNYCLLDFDKKIINEVKPVYYARYVDDILIICTDTDSGEKGNVKSNLEKYLKSIFRYENCRYYFAGYKRLYIQDSKIKILKMNHLQSKSTLNVLINDISKASEPNLIPDLSLTIQNFMDSLYSQNLKNAKIREIDALSINKYNLINSITSYLKLKKNTTNSRKTDLIFDLSNIKAQKKIKGQYDELDYNSSKQMSLLFNSNTIFELYARWDKIFYFTLLTREKTVLAQKLYEDILSKIENIKISQIENIADKFIEKVKKQVMDDLKEVAEISYSCAVAIRFKNGCDSESIKQLASKLRKANMFDHKMVACPLINFIDKKYVSYHVADFGSYNKTFSKPVLDARRIKFSPRFIHLHEYLLYKNIFFLDQISEAGFLKNIITEYSKLAEVIGSAENNELLYDCASKEKPTKTGKTYEIDEVYANSNKKKRLAKLDEIYIAMANINMSKKEIFNTDKKINFSELSFESKYDLLSLLKDAARYKKIVPGMWIRTKKGYKYIKSHYENQLTFIVFPELCIPFEWLNDVAEFCKNSKIAIIAGVRYYKIERRVYNLVATILPVSSEKGHKSALIDIREKNDYSPLEKRCLEQEMYSYNNDEKSLYKIYHYNGLDFSVFNCYELTDIYARANMKSKLDLLFAPEYNEDIGYFSNIIESVARDIYCFVAQVNSSSFGDTRIIGPLDDKHKNITTIKGGERSSLHVGKINIKEFRDYQGFEQSQEYNKYLDRQINAKKPNIKDLYRKYKKTSARHLPKK